MTRKQNFINKAQEKFGTKYDYSLVDYSNARVLVTIICPTHGEFKTAPFDHLRSKYGCPECANDTRTKNQTGSKEYFVAKAREKHGNKYDYALVQYVNARTKVTIVCREHGNFSQNPDCHSSAGKGCPQCADIAKGKGNSAPYLYILTCGLYTKIGISSNVNHRLAVVRTESKMDWELFASFHYIGGGAEVDEGAVHKFLSTSRAKDIPKFGGYTEVFKKVTIENFMHLITGQWVD